MFVTFCQYFRVASDKFIIQHL